MRDFKSSIKNASRRITFLREKSHQNSFDKAEISALETLVRVANVYNDARGGGGPHLENILYMVRDVLEETIEDFSEDIDAIQVERLQDARKKCTEGIRIIRNLGKEDE